MKTLEPPRLSTWLLERLAPRHKRESLIGDLREQYHEGRSAWWYRRQVLTTIVAGIAADIRVHKLLAVRAFIVGCAAFFLLVSSYEALRYALVIDWDLAPRKPELLRQAVVYYGVPFEIIMCPGLAFTGWTIARWHREYPGAMVILSALSRWPWAISWARGTGRLLQAGLWPGWGWGAYRWALLFHATLLFVGYPLCILIGGLWRGWSDAEIA
jgi:hypothetical protein